MSADPFTTARHISLTTFRADGTGVATPVWFAQKDGKLYVWTPSDSWKVKRLRRDPRVVITVCDARGRVREGAHSAEGTAELLDDPSGVRELLARKYTWQFHLVDLQRKALRRTQPASGVVLTLAATDA
ncbi:PPOX class F420-dependent oxidoreductase [Streptomyces uncialis]|uniref:PPOX class F420-dependent oxidoreductase n=1 Tax=Streptomyces uncialis TaxID=1048205 RepID=UPI0022546F49|nr:PPOX class F420-dependent oxidoreductase [Streptomyces uncialis]MCX4661768.1 PPOX class F420-dependent oxidoreductase [Streptomyces uncialis]